jgi:hypothetical protein
MVPCVRNVKREGTKVPIKLKGRYRLNVMGYRFGSKMIKGKMILSGYGPNSRRYRLYLMSVGAAGVPRDSTELASFRGESTLESPATRRVGRT